MLDNILARLSHDPVLAAGLAVAAVLVIGLIAVIALLLRKPKPVADPEAEQRLRELNARLDAMGGWLQNSHTQLQHTVNTRLDAVSQNLGESMKTSTKHTTDYLQQLHARLAVIDSAQKNITDLAGTVTSLQNVLVEQAIARRLRARASWRRSSPTCCRRAPMNFNTRCRTGPSRTAWCSCRIPARWSSTPSFRSKP